MLKKSNYLLMSDSVSLLQEGELLAGSVILIKCRIVRGKCIEICNATKLNAFDM